MSEYFVGLDIGQAQDYTALCVVEVPSGQRIDLGTINPRRRRRYEKAIPKQVEPQIKYSVRHLQRFPLRTPYPKIVADVGNIVKRLYNATLVIDQTGVGRPIYDMFRKENIRLIGITIHGGDLESWEGQSFRVPKRDLVGALTLAFQNGELKIAESLPEAQTLVNELLNFKVRINLKTAHDSYEAWREGVHDDLVLSLAVAVWYAARMKPWQHRITQRDGLVPIDIPSLRGSYLEIDDIPML